MKVLIAPDKFKGSLTAMELCMLLKDEISPYAEVEICPLADGGDGSLEVLKAYLQLEEIICDAVDPLGRPNKAAYYMHDKTAYIELAVASGLVLLNKSEQNPMLTSTFGTGLVIKNAIARGAEKIYLFLGGSSTNDGGIGIAHALGYDFKDKNENVLSPVGSSLQKVAKIEASENLVLPKELILCCDVKNPPFGEHGAARVYAKQKGASAEEIEQLDQGMKNLCTQLMKWHGTDTADLEGGGAAGGVAVALYGLFAARMQRGFDLIAKVTDLESKILNSDLVISGEGKIDIQSFHGKVPSEVAGLCRKYGKRLVLMVGKNDLSTREMKKLGAERLYAVDDFALSLEDAMGNARYYVRGIGKKILEQLKSKGG